MRRKLLALLVLCAIATTGCYVATIETGLPASNVKIEKKWAKSFVYGLVPPETITTMTKCPHGVAKVVTQHSFLNGLVAVLTFSIFTPMTIEVTCARPPMSSKVGQKDVLAITKDASIAEFQNVFMLAGEKAVQSGNEVFVLIKENTDNKD